MTPVPKPESPKPRYYSLPLIASSGAFSHEQASELFEGGWSLQEPFLASFVATSTNLEPLITVAAGTELAFQSVLYAVIGGLDITPRPALLERLQVPTLVSISAERHEDLESLPMKDVAENGRHDPINRILEAFYAGGLEEGESVQAHLFVRPAFSERLDRAYRTSYTESGWWIFKSRYPKFDPKVHEEVTERMRQYAFDVVSVIAVSGQDRDRLNQRAHAISAAFSSRTTNTGSKVRNFAYGVIHDEWEYRSSFSLNDIDVKDVYGTLMTVSELANLFSIPSEQSCLPTISRLKLPPVALPPSMLQVTGISIGIYHYRGKDHLVPLPITDLQRGPTVILGKTGQGKSTVGHQILDHANRLDSVLSICIVDPHGKWSEDFALHSILEDQLDRTYFIDFADTDWPIGLPLFRRPEGISLDAFIPDTFESIKLLFRENWSSGRMETVAFNTVAVLCHQPDASIRDIPRLYTDAPFRQQALSRVKNPAVLEFFCSYDTMSMPAQRELTAPVLNRVNALYRSEPIRNITSRADGLDIAQLTKEGANLLFSFIGPEIASEADTLMELVVAKIHLAMQARAHIPEHQRRPTIMALDESQRIKGAALPALLSQDRKFGLVPILLTQFLANWTKQVEEAVIGNNANLITFALGPDDARKLSPMLAPYTAQQLMDLNRHQAIAKISVNGITSPTFHMMTRPIEGEPNYEHLRIARENARRRFGSARADVDTLFHQGKRRASPPRAGMEMFDVGPTA